MTTGGLGSLPFHAPRNDSAQVRDAADALKTLSSPGLGGEHEPLADQWPRGDHHDLDRRGVGESRRATGRRAVLPLRDLVRPPRGLKCLSGVIEPSDPETLLPRVASAVHPAVVHEHEVGILTTNFRSCPTQIGTVVRSRNLGASFTTVSGFGPVILCFLIDLRLDRRLSSVNENPRKRAAPICVGYDRPAPGRRPRSVRAGRAKPG